MRAHILPCTLEGRGERGMTLQQLPWLLISSTIATDGKQFLVAVSPTESVVCLSALQLNFATRGSLRARWS